MRKLIALLTVLCLLFGVCVSAQADYLGSLLAGRLTLSKPSDEDRMYLDGTDYEYDMNFYTLQETNYTILAYDQINRTMTLIYNDRSNNVTVVHTWKGVEPWDGLRVIYQACSEWVDLSLKCDYGCSFGIAFIQDENTTFTISDSNTAAKFAAVLEPIAGPGTVKPD